MPPEAADPALDTDLAEARALLSEAAAMAIEMMRDLRDAQLQATTVEAKAAAAKAYEKVHRGLRMALASKAKLKREHQRFLRDDAASGAKVGGSEPITGIRYMMIEPHDQGTAHAVRDCILTETEGEDERCRELFEKLDAWLAAPEGDILWLPADEQVDRICVAIGLKAEAKPSAKNWPVKGPSRRLAEGLPPFPGPDEDPHAAGFL